MGRRPANDDETQPSKQRACATSEWLPRSVLLPLEYESDRLAIRPDNVGLHRSIGGEAVVFDGDGAGYGGDHLQDVVIPFGLGLKVLAGMDGAVVFVADIIAIKVRLGGARVHKAAGDDDDAVPVATNAHSAGLNDGLTGKIALGRYQSPGAVQFAMVVRKSGEGQQDRRQHRASN
jgi:hypothetical protein